MRKGGIYIIVFFGGGQREGYVGRTWPKKPKMALISEYLAADSSPDASADASADALAIINIRYFPQEQHNYKPNILPGRELGGRGGGI